MRQITNTVLMIRPIQFRSNEETAVNNYYQTSGTPLGVNTKEKAQQEFDAFVMMLRNSGVQVIVVSEATSVDTPDAVFPNNWISFHQNGDVVLYPMYAKNRRKERRLEILDHIETKGFEIKNIVDYTRAEHQGIFLEGTGSMVLDRKHRKAYCALSARADEDLFIEFCEDFEYTPVLFTAYQTVGDRRLPIYHTNVMMGITETFAIVGLDCIDNKKERKTVHTHLKMDGKEVIQLSEQQIQHFAGNVLQVVGFDEKPYLVMSSQAYHSLTSKQLERIRKHCEIIHSDLSTIEAIGGGSARCMMAEIFLPQV